MNPNSFKAVNDVQQGQNTPDANNNPVVLQANDYYPFGMSYSTAPGFNKYLYNSKEEQEMPGKFLDYGWRLYDPQLGRWHGVDPLAEKRNWVSTYSYCQNNPIRRIDPSGMLDEIFIKGEAAEEATKQLQQSTSLTLSRDSKTGKISATGKAKTKSDKQLLEAINDKSITVNVTARNSTKTTTGANFTGGAFMGNKVTENSISFIVGSKPCNTMEISYTTVVADQEVNPSILGQMDSYVNKPGAGMMHETTEAYEGAKISKQSGISAPPAKRGVNNPIYKQAHNNATKQPAANNTFMKSTSNGTIIYLGTEDRVDVILQTIK